MKKYGSDVSMDASERKPSTLWNSFRKKTSRFRSRRPQNGNPATIVSTILSLYHSQQLFKAKSLFRIFLNNNCSSVIYVIRNFIPSWNPVAKLQPLASPMLLPDMTDETVDEKFSEMIEENRYREVIL